MRSSMKSEFEERRGWGGNPKGHLFKICWDLFCSNTYLGFPGSSDGKASAYNVGDPGSIRGSGRSPGEENGNPLQFSCLENPMDGGAW